MCFFQQLYSGDEGYIVRCNECLYYQIGFGTSILTLSDKDLQDLKEIVHHKLQEADVLMHEPLKSVWLPASANGFALLLTFNELKCFAHMLEEADTEEKTLALLKYFDKG